MHCKGLIVSRILLYGNKHRYVVISGVGYIRTKITNNRRTKTTLLVSASLQSVAAAVAVSRPTSTERKYDDIALLTA